jgi:hypothetical protein
MVARFFLVQTYQNGKNIPDDHNWLTHNEGDKKIVTGQPLWLSGEVME